MRGIKGRVPKHFTQTYPLVFFHNIEPFYQLLSRQTAMTVFMPQPIAAGALSNAAIRARFPRLYIYVGLHIDRVGQKSETTNSWP